MTPPRLSRHRLATLGNPRRPGRQHQTPALAPTINRRGLVTLGAALVLGATSCTSGNDEEEYQGMFGWVHGDKPLAERQTIEDYQATVEAQLALFVQTMQNEGATATLTEPSALRISPGGGYELTTAIIGFRQYVSYARARELAGRLFPAVGLTTVTNDDEDGVFFHDEPNGGFVTLGDNGENRIGIYGTSGARPSTQTDPRTTRIVPEWEAALPPARPADPTSTSTPAPPPTKS